MENLNWQLKGKKTLITEFTSLVTQARTLAKKAGLNKKSIKHAIKEARRQ